MSMGDAGASPAAGPSCAGAAMKITAKQFAGFRRAYTASVFNGISANDGYNKQEFGITLAQYSALRAAAEVMLGMEASGVTLPMIKRFLAGDKVALARADDALIARVAAAFP